MNPVLVTMRGPGDSGSLQLQDLSNFEAGYLALSLIAKSHPGLKWGDLVSYAKQDSEVMAGWWTDLKKGTGSVVKGTGSVVGGFTDWVGEKVKDTFGATGDVLGDAVRLLTDKEVIDGLNSSYESFTKSGGVVGAIGGQDTFGIENLFGGGEKTGEQNQILEWINKMGAGLKSSSSGTNVAGFSLPGGALPWALGLGGVVVLMLFRGGRK